MRVRRLKIENFRGIRRGTIDFTSDALLVGGNNAGKSTICEALDLVLGPTRLYQRPVINEHDFYTGKYILDDQTNCEIRIEAILVDLSEEVELRFYNHLRRWNDAMGYYVDEQDEDPSAADAEGTCWALPIIFIGRYERVEDDFVGNTFFAHPETAVTEPDDEKEKLGAGLRVFYPEHKRLCGFIFLRTLRTGTRALSLQRGSLLDTILRSSGTGFEKMWQNALDSLHQLTPAIGEIEQLKKIRNEIEKRVRQFVGLAAGNEATAFFASDLTRENLREVVQFFVASQQSRHSIPFSQIGTGAINMLVFSLLTFIAELKESQSVIFAMEEPEIALPPHTQRRVVRFSLREMGQTIITSHSPYVIEQFEPGQIVMLNREAEGGLMAEAVDTHAIKPKTFKVNRRQFAEAVLSRAVLVVEGSTEAAMFSVASEVLEEIRGSEQYMHFDLAGVSLFDAGGDGDVARYGPIFKTLKKETFAFFDKRTKPLSADEQKQLNDYTYHKESPYKGVEELLVREMKPQVLQKFLDKVKCRLDYPKNCGEPESGMSNEDTKKLALKVLKARKGDAYGYAALLVAESASEGDLPITIRSILDKIQETLELTDTLDVDGEISETQETFEPNIDQPEEVPAS